MKSFCVRVLKSLANMTTEDNIPYTLLIVRLNCKITVKPCGGRGMLLHVEGESWSGRKRGWREYDED
jgi:hypothetical protein